MGQVKYSKLRAHLQHNTRITFLLHSSTVAQNIPNSTMASAEKPIGSHGFRSKLEHALYSGDKKHVFGGLVIITAIFGVPWYYMTRGSKQQSHQDYLEKADKARSERLSSSPPK